METVKDFIDKLGGTVKVANALGVPISTVSGWNINNSIPHWRVPALEEMAKAEKKRFPAALRRKAAA